MGYRTKNFHEVMETAEQRFRELLSIPDTHEVHFFNGGATLQFAAIPMNLIGERGNKVNYIMNGHWSEKAKNEAALYSSVHEVCKDPEGLYFNMPEYKDWNFDMEGKYVHYTAAVFLFGDFSV